MKPIKYFFRQNSISFLLQNLLLINYIFTKLTIEYSGDDIGSTIFCFLYLFKLVFRFETNPNWIFLQTTVLDFGGIFVSSGFILLVYTPN